MLRRRLQDRIKALVTRALATHDPDVLDAVIQQLREALHEHTERVHQLAATKGSSHPKKKASGPHSRHFSPRGSGL
jgi:hypothetical protein